MTGTLSNTVVDSGSLFADGVAAMLPGLIAPMLSEHAARRADVDMARSNPSFTCAQRIAPTMNKRRFSSCFIDSFSMTFAADDWVKAPKGKDLDPNDPNAGATV